MLTTYFKIHLENFDEKSNILTQNLNLVEKLKVYALSKLHLREEKKKSSYFFSPHLVKIVLQMNLMMVYINMHVNVYTCLSYIDV